MCLAKVLYEDSDFRITFRDTGSDIVVVAFSPMHWPERRTRGRHWGDVAAQKLPLSWLSIDAMSDHWFCKIKWNVVVRLVADTIKPFKYRVGYGHSMGAYAALKHSHSYQPTAILAFAPQWSIDPRDVGSFDTRYARAFDPRLHNGMRIDAEDLAAPAFLFFDDRFSPDAESARRIQGDPVLHIPVRYMRHDVVDVGKGSISLLYLVLRAALGAHGGRTEMHRYFRMRKKRNQDYLVNLAGAALRQGHPKWTKFLSELVLSEEPRRSDALILKLQSCIRLGLDECANAVIAECENVLLSDYEAVLVSRAMVATGLLARAVALIDRPSISEGKNTNHIRALAGYLLAGGQTTRGMALLERAVALAPDDPHCLAQLGKALMKSARGAACDLPRAVTLLERSTELDSSVLGFWKAYAMALEACGDYSRAVSAWHQVERRSELTESERQRLERLRTKVV